MPFQGGGALGPSNQPLQIAGPQGGKQRAPPIDVDYVTMAKPKRSSPPGSNLDFMGPRRRQDTSEMFGKKWHATEGLAGAASSFVPMLGELARTMASIRSIVGAFGEFKAAFRKNPDTDTPGRFPIPPWLSRGGPGAPAGGRQGGAPPQTQPPGPKALAATPAPPVAAPVKGKAPSSAFTIPDELVTKLPSGAAGQPAAAKQVSAPGPSAQIPGGAIKQSGPLTPPVKQSSSPGLPVGQVAPERTSPPTLTEIRQQFNYLQEHDQASRDAGKLQQRQKMAAWDQAKLPAPQQPSPLGSGGWSLPGFAGGASRSRPSEDFRLPTPGPAGPRWAPFAPPVGIGGSGPAPPSTNTPGLTPDEGPGRKLPSLPQGPMALPAGRAGQIGKQGDDALPKLGKAVEQIATRLEDKNDNEDQDSDDVKAHAAKEGAEKGKGEKDEAGGLPAKQFGARGGSLRPAQRIIPGPSLVAQMFGGFSIFGIRLGALADD